ncbi:hypothetical protein OIDMADRAFT_102029 [Oidiodendron maius Zn]|uniref:Calcineurin-like phosphoesterase domain-containing protein n=1 Tax=Oidiodendron maius (strain Zn) TaxID=913774 RepID=A0A0C3H5J7_OIDMZ|nr:hypothetical protein OIDMADRAFT_102029 [Oidiodendron maius Zn]
MSALIALVPAVIFGAFELLGVSSFLTKMATSSCCKEKDLYLHTAQQTAWLQIEQTREEHLTADDLVVTEIRVGELHPDAGAGSDEVNSWERRPGGIWVLRSPYTGDRHQAVTAVDVLFGVDAVDPRPQWGLMGTPLQLGAHPEVPVARLTIRQGGVTPRPDVPQMPLRVKEDGKFKIVQIADTHMVTGVGVCKDAIDAHGNPLPERGADPLTVNFIGGILDVEKPDLVILTGDQLHHDILDSQSTLFKVVAPLIERSIPYAVVFGNHDDEGTYALSRMAQMSLYQDMPFSLCQSGPELVDGVGNYYLQIFAPGSSQLPLSTLYFLDSHGQIPSKIRDPDYDPIKQSQIDWFTFTSQALRQDRHEKDNHLSLAFIHIPIPEYADSDLIVRGGKRREPTEGPSFNSHFYDALTQEGIAVLGCGHDHVNDFCALRPPKDSQQDGDKLHGPWLCYGGGSGFGGYCSYGDKRYHRRTRVFELDTRTGGIKTWKRVEYAKERIDELDLVDSGKVVDHTPAYNLDGGTSAQVVL